MKRPRTTYRRSAFALTRRMLLPSPNHRLQAGCYMRFISLFLFACARLVAASYYIDDRAGDDTAEGTTPARAWRSLEPVNKKTFKPGDQILLHAGSRWEGVSLHPLGSGTAAAPIVLGRYG